MGDGKERRPGLLLGSWQDASLPSPAPAFSKYLAGCFPPTLWYFDGSDVCDGMISSSFLPRRSADGSVPYFESFLVCRNVKWLTCEGISKLLSVFQVLSSLSAINQRWSKKQAGRGGWGCRGEPLPSSIPAAKFRSENSSSSGADDDQAQAGGNPRLQACGILRRG